MAAPVKRKTLQIQALWGAAQTDLSHFSNCWLFAGHRLAFPFNFLYAQDTISSHQPGVFQRIELALDYPCCAAVGKPCSYLLCKKYASSEKVWALDFGFPRVSAGWRFPLCLLLPCQKQLTARMCLSFNWGKNPGCKNLPQPGH